MKDITIKKINNLEVLQFNRLLEFQDRILHGFTLKTFDFGINKEEEDLNENLYKIANCFEINSETIIKPKQTHSDNVAEIFEKKTSFENIDGLITNRKNITLAITFADCICMMLYDPKSNVISNVHSGWKGTTKRIIQKAIYKMIKDYNSKTENIICAIGPAIRKDHFIVNEDVTNEYKKELFDICKNNDIIEKTNLTNEKGKQYRIDSVLVNKLLLKEMGVIDKNILDCEICTVCDKDKFHSYRMEENNYKKNLGIIMMK